MRYLILLFTFFLSACTTTVTITYNETFQSKLDPEKKISGSNEIVCEKYTLPVFDAVPLIDTDKYESLTKDTDRIKYLILYIKELRLYISEIKKANLDSYNQYIKKCN